MTTISNSVQAGEQLHYPEEVKARSFGAVGITYVETRIAHACSIHVG